MILSQLTDDVKLAVRAIIFSIFTNFFLPAVFHVLH